jgi:hypothetical protein
LGWFRLAARLGMSLDEVKAKHSASQFIQWLEFLEWEFNSPDKICYYLAQIAAEMRRSQVKSGVVVRLEDFLIKFARRQPERKRVSVQEGSQAKMDRFKQAFFTLTGLSGKNKTRRKP